VTVADDDFLLSVMYQPMFELDSGRLSGFEALARWNHAVDGEISPNSFIPVAEETGLIIRLSDFVLHCACHQLREWQRMDPSLAELHMNVNISGNDIAHRAFVARVTRALIEAGLQPRHLTLELTENILAARIESALPLLGELRELGVGLAIDDFGTGYSSLSYLKKLPVDAIKIDGSFVRDIEADPNDEAIIKAILAMAHSLRLVVVAEGVETRAQFEALRELGCDEYQGFHESAALPPAQFEEKYLIQPGDQTPIS